MNRNTITGLEAAPAARLPFVSVCTPTFNRRQFIPYIIECFRQQDYPKERMEWVIVDDGSDKVEDLVCDIPQVRYFKYDKKMRLGKKRNLMHTHASGDIIVYMDDDDYYPPERVSHAVRTLTDNPRALCAGSSVLYIYFKDTQMLCEFGPYSPNHATAGTFAFKRELLDITRYEDTDDYAEEKAFLKDYTVPFAQLDPSKTTVLLSHDENTVDKRGMMGNPRRFKGKVCCMPIERLVENPKNLELFRR